jgi:hypothetical protein
MKMFMSKIKLVATDLDGTFLKDNKSISEKNILSLHLLGNKNILRVAATGRNLQKVKDVIPEDISFDYIVFSSGAGIYDWKNKKHIYFQNVSKNTANALIQFLKTKKLNFNVFGPVPENHNYWFYKADKNCPEFEKHFKFNRSFAKELKNGSVVDSEVSQFLVIMEENVAKYLQLKEEIEKVSEELRVVRTSSPITHGYLWLEVFHQLVSKGNGLKHICDRHKINYQQTLGVGNDYNDIDLLDFTEHSFITENAPQGLRKNYKNVPSNENDGFSFAIQPIV